jgi:hypothetical protein
MKQGMEASHWQAQGLEGPLSAVAPTLRNTTDFLVFETIIPISLCSPARGLAMHHRSNVGVAIVDTGAAVWRQAARCSHTAYPSLFLKRSTEWATVRERRPRERHRL